jgi:hypothetical protein
MIAHFMSLCLPRIELYVAPVGCGVGLVRRKIQFNPGIEPKKGAVITPGAPATTRCVVKYYEILFAFLANQFIASKPPPNSSRVEGSGTFSVVEPPGLKRSQWDKPQPSAPHEPNVD